MATAVQRLACICFFKQFNSESDGDRQNNSEWLAVWLQCRYYDIYNSNVTRKFSVVTWKRTFALKNVNGAIISCSELA